MINERFFLGCPIWSNRDWVGRFFSDDARMSDFLRQYSAVFNTVEGNTTFYGLPSADTVVRWCEEAADGFQFCFKFPRTISHDMKLVHAASETTAFLQRMAPLCERLGPFMLQLPPEFGPDGLSALARYLGTLPKDFNYAVEVRHREFFSKGDAEKTLNRLLYEHSSDRVMLDSRALFSTIAKDSDTLHAQQRKPQVPVHVIALGVRPIVRFIGAPDIVANQPFLEPWAKKVAAWLEQDLRPYIFTHTPNNRFAPELARSFHLLLQQHWQELPELPRWPVEESAQQTQFALF